VPNNTTPGTTLNHTHAHTAMQVRPAAPLHQHQLEAAGGLCAPHRAGQGVPNLFWVTGVAGWHHLPHKGGGCAGRAVRNSLAGESGHSPSGEPRNDAHLHLHTHTHTHTHMAHTHMAHTHTHTHIHTHTHTRAHALTGHYKIRLHTHAHLCSQIQVATLLGCELTLSSVMTGLSLVAIGVGVGKMCLRPTRHQS